MKLVHISDLHFGRERIEAVDALRAWIVAEKPDLVVVSGDLTQRALPGQFRAAKAFLNSLETQWLAVPGNHDMPLYALGTCFVQPLDRYKRWLYPQTDFGYAAPEAVFFGINTAGRIAWKKGRVKSWQAHQAKEFFSAADPRVPRILVAHHPVEPRDFERVTRVRETGADLILSGHLHQSEARLLSLGEANGDGPWILLSGTSVSARERGERNSFNEILIAADGFQVRVHTLAGREFEAGQWSQRPWGACTVLRRGPGVSIGKPNGPRLN